VVISDLDFGRVGRSFVPSKHDAKLIVDPYAPAVCKIAFQHFQTVTRRRQKVLDMLGGVKTVQLALRDFQDMLPRAPAARLACAKDAFSLRVAECRQATGCLHPISAARNFVGSALGSALASTMKVM
jgi:hypothetical protein